MARFSLMGSNVTEVVEILPSPCDIKVHAVMCTQLIKLVDRVDQIFPEIEAAQPNGPSGIDALFSLKRGIDKAKSVIHDCCESSKLYLAYKGNSVLSNCKKSKDLLVQSLRQLQNMVYAVMLEAKIYQIIGELSVVRFSLNPSEEEAGEAVNSLIKRGRTGNSSEKESENELIQIVAQKLHITSPEALSVEQISIRTLLGRLDEGRDKQKKQILIFFLHLLKKVRKSITSGHIENGNNVQNEDYKSQTVDFHVDREKDVSVTPPEEFKCFFTHEVMYDPVVTDSGQTFERMWIQKWLDQGHDTCPKTEKKLSNHSLISNTAMKEQISNWCETYGITVSNPFRQFSNDVNEWDDFTSSFNSLSSMSSLQLPVDYSYSSISSLENSCVIEDTHTPEFDELLSKEIDDALPWEFQRKFVEDLMTRLKNDVRACKLIACKNMVGSLVRFLKLALDSKDVKAQRVGCLLLLNLVRKCRSIPYLSKDAYQLIAEFLDSEVIEEALAITEELSASQNCRSQIASSGSITYIFKILNTRIRKIQTPALKILYNLTLTRNVRSFIVSSDLIPKVVALSKDNSLSRYCIAILANLCTSQDDKNIIAETKGCISFVAKVLRSDNQEEQEHALDILVSLCSQSVNYCRLVMDEDVNRSLGLISSNGSDKRKAKAYEMLRLLEDTNL